MGFQFSVCVSVFQNPFSPFEVCRFLWFFSSLSVFVCFKSVLSLVICSFYGLSVLCLCLCFCVSNPFSPFVFCRFLWFFSSLSVFVCFKSVLSYVICSSMSFQYYVYVSVFQIRSLPLCSVGFYGFSVLCLCFCGLICSLSLCFCVPVLGASFSKLLILLVYPLLCFCIREVLYYIHL
jgi:hypothetical protein